MAYLAKYELYINAKKAYIQSEKCFYVIATSPNICYTKNQDCQAAIISDELWTNENIKKYYKKQEDWYYVYIIIYKKIIDILLYLSFDQLMTKF